MNEPLQPSHRSRDATALQAIGGFFLLLGGLLGIAPLWIGELSFAVGVELVAACTLLLVGAGMFVGGRRLARPTEKGPS